MTALLAGLRPCAALAETPPTGPVELNGMALNLSPAERAARETASVAFAHTVSNEPSVPGLLPPPPTPDRNRPRRVRVLTLAALTLGLAGVAYLGNMAFRVRPPEGAVVVELQGKPIEVRVNEDKTLTITNPDDGKPIHVMVEKDSKVMTLTQEGFQALALEFSLATKDGRRLTARFVPSERTVVVVPGNPDRAPTPLDQAAQGATSPTAGRALPPGARR
jgi:hypothetical protein